MTVALSELFDELANTILAVVGPQVTEEEVQVVGRRNFNPTPPSIDIYPADPFRDHTNLPTGFQNDPADVLVVVRARVTTVDNIAGQDLLLRFMDEDDPIGIEAVLEDDQTLNGLASSVAVETCSGYLQYVEGGVDGGALLGCEWRVRVLRAYS